MIHVIDNAAPIAILDFIRSIAEKRETWHYKCPTAAWVQFKDKHPKLDLIVNGNIVDNFLAGLAIGALMSTFDRGGHEYFFPEVLYSGISIKDSTREDNTHVDHDDRNDIVKVLYLLNTDWQEEWKGGFKYDGEVYNFKPGTAIIFDPRVPHSADEILGDEKRLALDFSVRKTTLS